MAEQIARYKPGDSVPIFADTAITGGRFVKVTAAKNVDGAYPGGHCGAGERSFGVAEYDSAPTTYPEHATDRMVNVTRPGSIARVEAGAAVSALAEVQSDASGRAVSADAVEASVVTGVVASNNAIRWTAKAGGDAGEALSITIVDPAGNNVALSVDVDQEDIVVTLATDGSSNPTSTAADVIAAVNEHDAASQLVDVANEGASDGTGVVAAVAETSLAGGVEGHANGQALVAAAAAGDIIEVALY